MNLLKQTALVLGLVSLSLGGWALFKNWRQKLAILYSILCFTVAGWALSFVSYATLMGRISKDIHWIFNIWLAPIGVLIVSKILSARDKWGKWFFRVSLIGAVPLSLSIMFSIHAITDEDWFWVLVRFWPTFILMEFIHVLIADLIKHQPVDIDFISTKKRRWLYGGLVVSLASCSFDHIPNMGYLVPSIGNLAFAAYLAFASQVMSPQKILGIEALLSRFFAVVILSLVITGYFALLYQYMSETFGLFVLNSFLISFSVLALWSPLVTLFRIIARRLFRSESEMRKAQVESFKLGISGVTSLVELGYLLEGFFRQAMKSKEPRLEFDLAGVRLPDSVKNFFTRLEDRWETPLLHRALVQMERDQVLTHERRHELDLLLQYLDHYRCDLIFPVFADKKVIALVRVEFLTSVDEWTVSLSFYALVAQALQALGPALQRIAQVESTLEKDRLALMGEMAAGLAHEIRNPLGAIKGATELMIQQEGQQKDGTWTKVIQEEVERLNRLVSQFLDFSHSNPENPETVNLYELASRVIDSFKPSLPKTATLELIPPSETIQAMIAPDQIQQVLLNLLQNALKATDGRSETKIQVQLFQTGFMVSDNGVGMSEDTLARVFQPFFSSFRTGSGLGLSICQRLVASNDGSIQIQSRLGEGTTVKVNLCETRSSLLMTSRT
ncbi:MAG: hypothetical protein JST80_10535 [Bdellovibrionales bacterium]|nr:hypothetical protein [Bdellovibrionales bacterium]